MAASNYQSNKNGVDVSFDSSSNHGGFSQAGTPMSYKVKLGGNNAGHTSANMGALKGGVKNLNLISASTVSGSKLGGLSSSNPAA